MVKKHDFRSIGSFDAIFYVLGAKIENNGKLNHSNFGRGAVSKSA